MARFDTTGLTELIQQMEKNGDDMNGALNTAMLQAGAEAAKQCWVEVAEERNHKLSKQMIDSIGYAKEPKKAGDVAYIDIYPQGKDSRGVRNMEKAAWTHYGWSNTVNTKAGDLWIDEVDRRCGERVIPAMNKVYEDYLKQKG